MVVIAPGLSTPRISMHKCRASITTMDPLGANLASRKSTICWVETLLELGPAGVEFDDAHNFAQADDRVPRYVGYVRLAKKRDYVVGTN